MADKFLKYPGNVPGKYYVDQTCIDCDQCRNIAPQSFTRDEEGGHSIVFKQPEPSAQIHFRKNPPPAPPKRGARFGIARK
jgi:ferredoxin